MNDSGNSGSGDLVQQGDLEDGWRYEISSCIGRNTRGCYVATVSRRYEDEPLAGVSWLVDNKQHPTVEAAKSAALEYFYEKLKSVSGYPYPEQMSAVRGFRPE